jgi:myo-inositol-1(or 4)-monophosphatase
MDIDLKLVEELKNLILISYNEAIKLDKNIKNKELNDIVTDVDIYMETKIIQQIKEWFPEHSIYSEERGEIIGNSNYVWFIDPIDGTINFAAGIPLFSTSVALKENDETIFGLVIDYNQNDVYYAFKGKGAFCNNERLRVSNNEKLSNSILSFCLTSHYNDKHIKDILKVEECLAPKVRGLRLVVSGAIELCWCASGKIDGVINVKPSIGLSSAAGKLFVKESGGKITNLNGNERNKIDTLLVTNGKIHDEVVETIKNIVE